MPTALRSCLSVAVLLTSSVLSHGATAQEPCFPTIKTPPWTALDVGLVRFGASRPVPGAVGLFELCSSSAGFGATEDSLRYLFQGTRADFEMTVCVERVEDTGLGGVMAAWDGRTPDEPYVEISAHRLATGGIELRSSFRANTGEKGSPGRTQPIQFGLPAYLRVRREGTTFTTAFSRDGKSYTDHLKVDGGGTALGELFFTAGMAQASENRQGSAHAVFRDPRIASKEVSFPPRLLSVSPPSAPVEGGVEVTITGERLATSLKVMLAGIDAKILEAGDGSVRVLAGAAQNPISGDVVVETKEGSDLIEQAFVYIGHKFIRGDFNHDGTPDLSDAVAGLNFLFQGGRAPLCLDAADTNSDGKLDLSDEVFLLGHLYLGTSHPLPPYPDQGIDTSPGIACGLPSAPIVKRISPTTIREGEVVTLYGSGFDQQEKERNIVQIGGSLAEVLDVDGDKLTVKAGPILRPELSASILTNIGDIFNLLPFACLTKKCGLSITGVISVIDKIPLSLISSDIRVWGDPHIDEKGGVFALDLDRAQWNPKNSYDIHASFLLPAVQGMSRGPRLLELEHRDYYPGVTFGDWLQGLAGHLQDALGGSELRVTADEKLGRLLFKTDKAITPFLQASRFSDSIISIIGIDWHGKCGPGNLDPIADSRAFGWCRFEEITADCGGLPKWEYFIPKQDVFQISDAIFPLPFPWQLTTGQKRVMYNRDAYCHVRKQKLFKTCTLDNLVALGRSEIPNFPQSAIVVKTGWTTEASIISRGGDPSKYYKYTDSLHVTHYLELFHFTTKDIDNWFWATFWVPTPNDPGLPTFNCGSGTGADKPASIPAPWSNYSMCVNTAEDMPCGNVNFAAAECPVAVGDRGCMSCHKDASYSGMKDDFLFSLDSGPPGTCP